MSDAELQAWWPELGTVVAELRRRSPAVADLLVGAIRTGDHSSEVLGSVGTVLREHRALRSRLGASGAKAWDAVMRDVYRAFPGWRLAQWFYWLMHPRTWRRR